MQVTLTTCQLALTKISSFEAFEKQVLALFDDVPETSDYVLLPELCTLGLLTTFEDFEQLSLTDYDRVAGFLPQYKELFTRLATERKQVIIAGSTLEKDGDKIFNTAYIFAPDGQYYTHRKSHIFPAENLWHTCEGDELRIFDVGPVKFGVAICYEIEIPEIATIYQKQGADIIFVPSYTFTPHGFWRVRHCAQSRAIENQVYIAHCPTSGEQMGIINPGFGQAAILSPCDTAWTENGVLVENAHAAVITATVSIEALEENRQTGAATTLKDRARRSDLYNAFIQS